MVLVVPVLICKVLVRGTSLCLLLATVVSDATIHSGVSEKGQSQIKGSIMAMVAQIVSIVSTEVVKTATYIQSFNQPARFALWIGIHLCKIRI